MNHSLFYNAFSGAFPVVTESVLDFPNGKKLCSDIWTLDGNKYKLNENVRKIAMDIVDWAVKKYDLKNPTSRIVGSIGSNTYSNSSDIDIHISADNITDDNFEELNKEMISEFKKTILKGKNGKIKTHPFECYFQPNKYQDYMSVACYDLETEKWISGPEILSEKFNPYEEYYDGIQKHLDNLSEDIRKHVLECGEVASVVLKIVDFVPNSDKFLQKMVNRLRDMTVQSRKYFTDVRKKRSIASNPKSEKDALKKRVSKEWKIADSSFKFMDKLGYIATLLSIAKVGEDDSLDARKLSEGIISAIHDNLFSKDRTGYADIDK